MAINFTMTDEGWKALVSGGLRLLPTDTATASLGKSDYKIEYDAIEFNPFEKKVFLLWKGTRIFEFDIARITGLDMHKNSLTLEGMQGFMPFTLSID
jgi:hypothetical protein